MLSSFRLILILSCILYINAYSIGKLIKLDTRDENHYEDEFENEEDKNEDEYNHTKTNTTSSNTLVTSSSDTTNYETSSRIVYTFTRSIETTPPSIIEVKSTGIPEVSLVFILGTFFSIWVFLVVGICIKARTSNAIISI